MNRTRIFLLLTALVTTAVQPRPVSASSEWAEGVLASTDRVGGVVVYVGDDVERLVSLRVSDACTVQGLFPPEMVDEARAAIRKRGLYGPISVDAINRDGLPYKDNIVNGLVVDGPIGYSDAEMLRVLAPGGFLYVAGEGVRTKPVPETTDEWTHYLHDATNNAVARDEEVGPPRCIQWIAPPLWLRSHETPSGIQAMISGGGRLFYIHDEGLIGVTDERLPDRWSLICRDAYNGKLLWKKPIEPWGWRTWSYDRWAGKDWTTLRAARTDVPEPNQRRLVAGGGVLFTTLGYDAPLAILDSATGETIREVPGTACTREIIATDQGTAIVYATSPGAEHAARRGGLDAVEQPKLLAVDGTSGEIVWEKVIDPLRPLCLTVDQGRVIYQSGGSLGACSLDSGEDLWSVKPVKSGGTQVTVDGVVLVQVGPQLTAYDGENGAVLWNKKTYSPTGIESVDLFVADGLVWRGVASVASTEPDEKGQLQINGKSPNVVAIGFDLRTGEEVRRVAVSDIRSPEHHHRCYRNKATDRFLITGLEGLEFIALGDEDHSQDNWLRGACRYGIMPCNGMVYVPPDQCFCEPGAKLLGLTAVAPASVDVLEEVPDDRRLQLLARGNASPTVATVGDWPTFRHDPKRSGAASTDAPTKPAVAWSTALGGKLTQPIAVGDRVYVAAVDAHTLYALDASSGEIVWAFTAGGRIDSPPTYFQGRLLFGSADGYVYNLSASDGRLVWRFLAAPADRRCVDFDQIESVWPVHGSVLVSDGLAYFTAGRSSYLDGGVRVWAIDPITGAVRHKTVIEGPFPEETGERDVSFYVLGANSDVLVAEDGFVYMRQKKLTPELDEIDVPVLSSKGEQNVGRHVFSTAGLLDDSAYNRAFWLYADRWPGFQLTYQAPKSGQLLVCDDENTYGVKYFYRRNVHSGMFFPAREGYMLFSDKNTTEPQIVGEAGARKPMEWLPQSEYIRRGTEVQGLDTQAFGLDKMIGYTRAEGDPPRWTSFVPIRVRAMTVAGDRLYIVGPPDVLEPESPYAAFEGERGAVLGVVSTTDGRMLSQTPLDSAPAFDGLIAANGRLLLATRDGEVLCFEGE